MRTPTLQYLYLQKPLMSLLLITIISTCWIFDGDFYTKGEPREAAVAVSMIEKGEWILPHSYADEIAYKPPFTHWFTALFSLPEGEVTPFTSRLPSVLAFLLLIGSVFIFLGRRIRGVEAFLATIILITSFELHRSAMTARVDMTLTAFIVWGLLCLYRWEERFKLKGFPFGISLIFSCAILIKGPVGIVLPMIVFGIYLLLIRYNFWKIAGKLIMISLASMIIPAIWYYLAYLQGGQEFWEVVKAENFGRFFGSETNIKYDLGHEEPVWYNFITLAAGFIPWTIFLFFSLFGISYAKKYSFKSLWNKFLSMDRIRLFSLVAAIVIIVFYSIPISKRSVYLMPAYPFIAVFIAQYVIYLTEYKTKVTKVFSWFIGCLGILVALVVLLTVLTPWVDPVESLGFIKSERTMADITATWNSLNASYLRYLVLFFILAAFLYILGRSLNKKNNLKILTATIGTYIAIVLILDGIFLPAFKNGSSVKPFAKKIEELNPSYESIYVVNNLKLYRNMYGMNFYLHNNFRNFEKELPETGFFLIGAHDFEKFYPEYQDIYEFELITQTENRTKDVGQAIQYYSFSKK